MKITLSVIKADIVKADIGSIGGHIAPSRLLPAVRQRRPARMKACTVAAIAFGACAIAQAHQAWRFEFSGLVGQESYFRSEGEVFSVVGTFAGSDLDRNGELTTPEIKRFTLQGDSVVPTSFITDTPDGEPVPRGHLFHFRYLVADNTLDAVSATYLAGFHSNFVDLAWPGFYAEGAGSESWTYSLDAPGVELKISPVPEPGTYALMLIGLTVLGVAKVRARSGSRRELPRGADAPISS